MFRTTSRRMTATALGAVAAFSAVALAPGASALTTEDIPLVNGHRQGHISQGVHKTEITHPIGGATVPIEFRPSIGCMGPGQVDPAGEPREGIFIATDDMTPRDPGLGSIADPAVLIPTSDTLTVTWTNHSTGESGETVASGQRLRTEARINTGTGHVTGTAVLATQGPLGGLAAGSLGGADEARYDFDFTTVACTP